MTQVAEYGLKSCKVPESLVQFEDKGKLDQAEEAVVANVLTLFKAAVSENEDVQMNNAD